MASRDAGRRLRILQVGAVEAGGGAASVAANLRRGYRERGHEAWLATGLKTSDDPDVFVIPDDNRLFFRATGYAAIQRRLRRLAARAPGTGWGAIGRSLRLASHPRALIDRYAGREDFEFPGSLALLDLVPSLPDIVHCHNLHGGYFDLRALVSLSRRVPTVVTLHDAWLLSGHCAHSFDCDRWQTGCGECPDLAIPPAIRRDATADNWRRKGDIFAQSRLYVAAPSQWLLQRVSRSMLAPAVRQAIVIPNGVDLTVFCPAGRNAARARLGIAPDVPVVLFTTGPRTDPWRDVALLQSAIPSIALRMSGTSPLFLGIGADASADDVTGVRVELRRYQSDRKTMADYYRAADVYLHAARADTFPSAVLEALACGTPVVATDVGGIPEQIRNGSTGTLIPAADSGAMADAVVGLLTNADARRTLSENAARDARDRFDVNPQIDRYLAWYRTILDDRGIQPQV